MIPDNFHVAVVICPVCHEPVIADQALSSSAADPPVKIRHHTLRRAEGRNIAYCIGSKLNMPRAVAVDRDALSTLVGQEPLEETRVEVEFHADRSATVTEHRRRRNQRKRHGKRR